MVDRLANSEANSKRIALVESCFGAAGQPLAIPGRVLIGEGVLTKLCRKKPKARQFFLFNDILVYGNIVIQKKKYNKQHIIPLESVTIDTVPDEGDLRNGWLIKTPTKSFAVYAATATEKSEWMNHIGKCVGDLLQKKRQVPDRRTCGCMGTRLGGFCVHALQEGEVHTSQPPPSLQEMRICGLWAVLGEEVPPAQPVVQTGSCLRVLLRAADVCKPPAAFRHHHPAGVKVKQQQPVG